MHSFKISGRTELYFPFYFLGKFRFLRDKRPCLKWNIFNKAPPYSSNTPNSQLYLSAKNWLSSNHQQYPSTRKTIYFNAVTIGKLFSQILKFWQSTIRVNRLSTSCYSALKPLSPSNSMSSTTNYKLSRLIIPSAYQSLTLQFLTLVMCFYVHERARCARAYVHVYTCMHFTYKWTCMFGCVCVSACVCMRVPARGCVCVWGRAHIQICTLALIQTCRQNHWGTFTRPIIQLYHCAYRSFLSSLQQLDRFSVHHALDFLPTTSLCSVPVVQELNL